MIHSDQWIIEQCEKNALIHPFEKNQVKKIERNNQSTPAISYGVSSYGYDIRVARDFRVLDPNKPSPPAPLPKGEGGRRPGEGTVIDPKNFDLSGFTDFEGDVCILPPHGMAIAQSFETFRIPRNILVICFGKSTYARCGIQVSIAPLEPEWEGRLTFSIVNTTSSPAKVYSEEGIAQILFLEAAEVCQTSYADRKGKYQGQTHLTLPKV